jgi:hypothetical protein
MPATQRVTLDLARLFAVRRSGPMSVEVRASPLVFDLDPVRVGAPVAAALSAELRAQVERQPRAAASTVASRKVAARAWHLGKDWARRAYPAGPPTASANLLLASGYLARALRLEAWRGGEYAARAPAGRLRDATVRQRVLRLLVPIIAQARGSRSVAEARRAATRILLGRAR